MGSGRGCRRREDFGDRPAGAARRDEAMERPRSGRSEGRNTTAHGHGAGCRRPARPPGRPGSGGTERRRTRAAGRRGGGPDAGGGRQTAVRSAECDLQVVAGVGQWGEDGESGGRENWVPFFSFEGERVGIDLNKKSIGLRGETGNLSQLEPWVGLTFWVISLRKIINGKSDN